MEVGNLYDNGPLSPLARIRDNLAIWTENTWIPYKILNIEGIPQSSPYDIDLVTVALLTTIPANGMVQKQVIQALQVDDSEFIHMRWEPIDDVEGGLWELANVPRYAPRGGAARTSPFTADRDPYLASTTFWVLGGPGNKDVNVAAYNLWAVPQATARFAFWGYRYMLERFKYGSDAERDSILQKYPMTGVPAQAF